MNHDPAKPSSVANVPHAANTPSAANMMEPGQWVAHDDRPDWGPGQVQSVIGDRVTVNFEHAGKQLINTTVIGLTVLEGPP